MYQPRIPFAEQQRIREWHDRAYATVRSRDTLEIDCVGTRLVVPREVFAPAELQCARLNARRNGVSDRIPVSKSDLFQSVDGRFDLIVFDPPFRWFQPRDLVEAAITDENYESLTRFIRDVRDYLSDAGRVLVHFGTSADLPYLHERIEAEGFSTNVVAKSEIGGEWPVSYFVFRLTRPDTGPLT